MNNIKFFAAAICLVLMNSFALAQQNSNLNENTFAIINGKSIPTALIDFLAGPDPLQGPQLNQLARRLLANIAVAQKAEEIGLDKKENVEYELDLNRTQILARAYIEDYLTANPVTSEQVESRYAEFTAQAAGQFEYRSRHILVENEDFANDLLQQADGDVDKFAELAVEHSIDTGSGANGGLLDWTTADTFVPEFTQALQSLAPGEFTPEAIETQFGWHLIYLDERREIQIPELDDEQRQRVTEALRAERIQIEFDRILSESDVELSDAIQL